MPAYDFWQYWRNCDDRDVGRFLRLFTDLALEDVARHEALKGSQINDAKIALANAVTALCRGEAAALGAERTARQTFAGGGLGDDLPTLQVRPAGIRLAAACTGIGFTESNGEAKRKIIEGAVRIDDIAEKDPGFLILVPAGVTRKLSLGKKKHGILRPT